MSSSFNRLLKEQVKIIWATEPKNYTGAGSTGDYVSLKNYNHATVVIQTGAWAAGTAAVTLEQATSAAGGGSKALAFATQYSSTGLTDDAMTSNAVTNNTFNVAAANKLHVIEIEASDLDINNGFTFITCKIASPGANADIYGVVYLLSQTSYAQIDPPSAIV